VRGWATTDRGRLGRGGERGLPPPARALLGELGLLVVGAARGLHAPADLGPGRIVASEEDAPLLFMNLV
jgi:hypothetical protein